MSSQTKNTIIIPTTEYNYLKKIEGSFEKFFDSFEYLKKVEKARKEIKSKQYVSQKLVFKRLGL